jgi:hypothetical protein
MPIRTSYETEDDVADYILGPSCLGKVALTLNWREIDDIQSIIDEALADYGTEPTLVPPAVLTDVSQITEIRRFERLVKIKAFEAALVNLRALYDQSGGGNSYARSQIQNLEKDLLRLLDPKTQPGRAIGVALVTGDFTPTISPADPRVTDIV